MRVFVHNGTDPGENLSLEETLLESPAASGDCCWLWTDEPSVILGRNQILASEVNIPYAVSNRIPVYRRKTGGGAVFHDDGVINFSFVIAIDRTVADCLESILSVLGLPALRTERNDVLWQGNKIIGTAQRIRGNRRLFHGSLLYSADLERLSQVLTPAEEKMRRHGVASVRARVCNCGPVGGMSAERFRLYLTDRLSDRFGVAVESLPESVLKKAQARRLSPLPYYEEA